MKHIIDSWKTQVLISFTSLTNTRESLTSWKVLNDSNFYSLYVDDDDANGTVTASLHNFIFQEIMNNRTGE